ncbi:hypothetical protein QNM18_06970 [Pseudoalteromonas sp. P94(2023)]|uniref:Cobalamin-independent methionine synthase MetE C-terminal/archaeal domain-containing protein n=1 Tax=Pseudoalteromonas obscura TaxID=3048491 RepID=A0ABT7EID2_9GAMM|nr:hypothetical protein [Pseudoalteromonas sp. P94(2023)]MDK2594802.1 hypothetical protein [Pseudoalteromonas sp. P94(2023)]
MQSYGSRCVKPPVIWGDVARARPMTLGWTAFAHSLTKKEDKRQVNGAHYATILVFYP